MNGYLLTNSCRSLSVIYSFCLGESKMRREMQVLSILVLVITLTMGGIAGGQTELPKPGATGNLNVAEAGNWTNGLPSVDNVGTITLSAQVDAFTPVWGTWRDNKTIIIESSDGHGVLKFSKVDSAEVGQFETQIRNEVDITLNSGTWEPYGDRQGLKLTGATSIVTVNGGLLDCGTDGGGKNDIQFRENGAQLIQNGGVVKCQLIDTLTNKPDHLYILNGGLLEIGPGGINNNVVRIDFSADSTGIITINTGTDYRATLLERVANGVISVGGVTQNNLGQFDVLTYSPSTGITTLQLNGPKDPLQASNPTPENGATNTPLEVTLSWTAGQDAAEHIVYMGSNWDDVNDAVGGVPQADTTMGPLSVEYGTTTYWRVDELQADGAVTKGKVWFFAPPVNVVIEDVEGYDDTEPNRIWTVWKDGYNVPENGSELGYAAWAATGDPNHESHVETIIAVDNQSTPFFYSNDTAAFSEVSASLVDLNAEQNWSAGGLKVMSLMYHADASNEVPDLAPDPLYVTLSDGVNPPVTLVNSDPNATVGQGWNTWHIILDEVFVTANTARIEELDDVMSVVPTGALDLTRVTEIAIGVGVPGGVPSGNKGLMFLDNIILNPSRLLPGLAPTALQGDLNGDGVIDAKDLAILEGNLGFTGLFP